MHFPFTSATVHFLHSRGNSNQRHNGPKFPDWHFIPQVGSSKYKINKRNTERTPRICDFIIRQISARHVWSFGSKFEVGLQPPINCQKDEEFGCRADQALFIQFGPMRCERWWTHHLYHGWTINTSQKYIYVVLKHRYFSTIDNLTPHHKPP